MDANTILSRFPPQRLLERRICTFFLPKDFWGRGFSKFSSLKIFGDADLQILPSQQLLGKETKTGLASQQIGSFKNLPERFVLVSI